MRQTKPDPRRPEAPGLPPATLDELAGWVRDADTRLEQLQQAQAADTGVFQLISQDLQSIRDRLATLEGASSLATVTARVVSVETALAALTERVAALEGTPEPEPGPEPPDGLKRVIEFGRDMPDTSFMRRQIAQMEATPFDGTVFTVKYQKPDGSLGDFQWDCWGSRAFTEAELAPALADLKATPFTRFRRNFLRFNTASVNRDWFDDFSAIVNNARVAATIAKQAHAATGAVPGILFDPEQYNDRLFTYGAQRDRSTKSFAVYAAQVRQRGFEIMTAFQQAYPGLTLFFTLGYSGSWYYAQTGGQLADLEYGLLAPFMDGIYQAAAGQTKIVDGYEIGFYIQPEQLHFGYGVKNDQKVIVSDVPKYEQHTSMGCGIWMDHNQKPWNTVDLSLNHWTPERFEVVSRRALELFDEYVWIFTDTAHWWSEAGTPIKLPAAYSDALRRARTGLAPGSEA